MHATYVWAGAPRVADRRAEMVGLRPGVWPFWCFCLKACGLSVMVLLLGRVRGVEATVCCTGAAHSGATALAVQRSTAMRKPQTAKPKRKGQRKRIQSRDMWRGAVAQAVARNIRCAKTNRNYMKKTQNVERTANEAREVRGPPTWTPRDRAAAGGATCGKTTPRTIYFSIILYRYRR